MAQLINTALGASGLSVLTSPDNYLPKHLKHPSNIGQFPDLIKHFNNFKDAHSN